MSYQTSETEIVSFTLDDGSYENLHAKRLGASSFLLDNSPFYIYDVSYQDEVVAHSKDGRLVFESVLRRGGHSTYRIKLPPRKTHEDFLRGFDKLDHLGCTFEGSVAGSRRLYSIDLPPSTDVAAVYEIMEDGEARGEWEFEEAHFFRGHR
ncbi:DUF4265 domain-containing protein [Erythrobacter sp. MTPC3]|uniref:DUF4265 domain-containing protein n=1 Tax=Erythrobacter sp. MTPC3 TaxID=3056564 RepID=UPI0036F27CC5